MKNKENARSRSDRDGTRTLTLQEKEDGHVATYLEPGRPVTAIDQIYGRRERNRAAGLGSLARANNRAPSRDYSTAACSATGRARTPARSSTAAPSRLPPSVTVGGRRSSAAAHESRKRRKRKREARGAAGANPSSPPVDGHRGRGHRRRCVLSCAEKRAATEREQRERERRGKWIRVF